MIYETIIIFTKGSNEMHPHSLWTSAEDANEQVKVLKEHGYEPVKYHLPIVLPEKINGAYLG